MLSKNVHESLIDDEQSEEISLEINQCTSCLYEFFCGKTICERLESARKGIFERRSGALLPLDGMRAFACLWVMLHNASNGDFGACLKTTDWFYLMSPVTAGHLGVELFFVLSGFLITHILLKDHDRYGDIDCWHFWRSRLIRIWPVLCLFTIYMLVVVPEGTLVKPSNLGQLWKLVFLNNFFTSNQDHIWSIAVEFQFYLFSPFLVIQMAKR